MEGISDDQNVFGSSKFLQCGVSVGVTNLSYAKHLRFFFTTEHFSAVTGIKQVSVSNKA